MDKREDNKKKYHIPKKTNRGWSSYRRNNLKNYFNKHLESFIQLSVNRNRDKNKKYISKIPYLMNIKPQNIRLQCPREVVPWSEEAVELERKQRVSDTAKKLMNKLKMWNTETNKRKNFEACCNERSSVALSEDESKEMEKGWENVKIYEQLINGEKEENLNMNNDIKKSKKEHDKCSEIIYSRNIQLRNNLNKSSKESLENKQKKIQENIIGELMTMPKENLCRVLVNPKIHPKLEKKMAQIVKENRLILAQKFRHLAESKINSHGQLQFQSKFIDDVENLINPDLAVDLCQLPPELIKQMGDIFQLDFDSCMKNTESQEDADNCSLQIMSEESTDNMMDFNVSSISGSSDVGNENRSDFERTNVIVGSQENITEKKIGKVFVKSFANFCCQNPVKMNLSSVAECNESDSEIRSEISLAGVNLFPKYYDSDCSAETNELLQNSNEHLSPGIGVLAKEFTPSTHSSECSNKVVMQVFQEKIKQQYPSDSTEHHQESEFSAEERISDERGNCSFCLNNNKLLEKKSSEIQTDLSLIDFDDFKGLQKGDEQTERSFLLKEVDLIDNLIHALNRRRFSLFLKLVNLNSCKSNNSLRNKLMEIVTNGDRTVIKKKKVWKKVDYDRVDNLQSKRGKHAKKPKKGALDACKMTEIVIKEESDSDVMIIDSVTKTVKKEYV